MATAPTPAYEAALAEKNGHERRRTSPADAFHAARETYIRGERLDMQRLAQQLGVSRGTLYRWTGDRERLLVDVVWSFAEELFAWTEGQVDDATGAEFVARRLDAFMHVLATSPAMKAFLSEDQDAALRILTRRGVGIQERAVARFAADIRALEARGDYAPRLDPDVLAYAIVRIVEGFVYHDITAGIEPDLAGAGAVIRALL